MLLVPALTMVLCAGDIIVAGVVLVVVVQVEENSCYLHIRICPCFPLAGMWQYQRRPVTKQQIRKGRNVCIPLHKINSFSIIRPVVDKDT